MNDRRAERVTTQEGQTMTKGVRKTCAVCDGPAHGRRPRQTLRMWGSPGADEPSAIDWCDGIGTVRVPLGGRLTRWRGVRPERDRRSWCTRLRVRWASRQWHDEEPF